MISHGTARLSYKSPLCVSDILPHCFTFMLPCESVFKSLIGHKPEETKLSRIMLTWLLGKNGGRTLELETGMTASTNELSQFVRVALNKKLVDSIQELSIEADSSYQWPTQLKELTHSAHA